MKMPYTAVSVLAVLSSATHTRAADFSPGNFLVANGGIVYEYTPAGAYVGQVTQDLRIGGDGVNRGITVDGDGGIHVLVGIALGDDSYSLASVASHASIPTYQSIANHQHNGNTTYGDIASDGVYVYAPDQFYGGPTQGIVRYSIENPGSPQLFLPELSPTDISFGYDGLLYAQVSNGGDIHVIDPNTMQVLRNLTTSHNMRDLEVRADGHIFAHFNDQTLRHYAPDGTQLGILELPNSANHSMAMSPDGTIIIGSGGPEITITDTSLTSASEVFLTHWTENNWGSFIAFGSPTFVRQLGDLTGDQHVGIDDLDLLLANWGDSVLAGTSGDLDGSGIIDGGDLQLVIANWGEGTPPDINIPEPGTAGLLAAMSLLLPHRRR